jgi:hypothetical protein
MKRIFIKTEGLELGSWTLPEGEAAKLNNNSKAQGELGWHIFMELINGAKEVQVVVRDEEDTG